MENEDFSPVAIMGAGDLKLLRGMIKNYGILIGSRKWGGSTANSDWDYAFDNKYTKEIQELLTRNGVRYDALYGYEDENGEWKNTMNNVISMKFIIRNKIINLITYNSKGMKGFRDVNKCMKALENTPIAEHIGSDKFCRVALVELLIKKLVPENGESKSHLQMHIKEQAFNNN